MNRPLIATACAILLEFVTHAGTTLHVATNGNDSWSGKLATPNAAGTDGPLASLTGARDALRRLRSSAGAKSIGAIHVQVQGGVYRMKEPFVLEPQDSGSADAPVVFSSAEGQRAVFSGGRVISGFRRRGSIWEAPVAETKEGRWYFQQLFVNGERRQRARSPNEGYHRIARLLPGPPIPNAKPVAREKFGFAPGDLRTYANLKDVSITLMHSWETSIHPIKSVDVVSNIVEFAAPMKEWWSIGYWEDAPRYYVENARELLDRPGEWYLDRASGILAYCPMRGEEPDQVEVVAPVLTELVRLAGWADKTQFVQHVTLSGLAFHHADWVLDPKGNSSTQAAVEVPAAITADGALNCAFENGEVAHIGTYGIWFRRGCKDGRIQRNRLFDLGAGGIRVGEDRMARTDTAETSRTLVDNNHIYAGGKVYAGCVGLWVAQSSGNRISHNDIHDFYYTGISVGWNWGLDPNRTSNNIIEFNHVHDLGHGVLSDAGLIYCLGVSPGSVIRNNVFHDIWPYSKPAFGWGIYLDAQCGSYTVQSNVVYNTQSGGLMFNNGGHQHTILNNVFAYSATHALWPYHEKRPCTFQRNIVYVTQGALLIPYGERFLNERIAAAQPLGDWDENVYWHTEGADALTFYRRTFAEWQALGLDVHSRIADPQFVDVAKRDFRLQPGSPATDLGIHPIDVSRAGLYGDGWADESRHDRCSIKSLPAPPPAPKPLRVKDNFEDTTRNSNPAHATVSGEERGASIRVSDERAATGKQSLKITDSASLQPSWQPHFYYEPNIRLGIIRQSFDYWMETNAQFFTEWRDAAAYPHNVGPSVRFDGDGRVTVAGKTIATVPTRQWVHVELEASVGKNAGRSFLLSLTVAGGQNHTFTNLPITGKQFSEVRWLGFSSTAAADTSVFIDNLTIE